MQKVLQAVMKRNWSEKFKIHEEKLKEAHGMLFECTEQQRSVEAINTLLTKLSVDMFKDVMPGEGTWATAEMLPVIKEAQAAALLCVGFKLGETHGSMCHQTQVANFLNKVVSQFDTAANPGELKKTGGTIEAWWELHGLCSKLAGAMPEDDGAASFSSKFQSLRNAIMALERVQVWVDLAEDDDSRVQKDNKVTKFVFGVYII